MHHYLLFLNTMARPIFTLCPPHPKQASLPYSVKFNTNTSLSTPCDPVTENNSHISSRHKGQNAIREGVAGPSTTRREVLGSGPFIAPLELQQQQHQRPRDSLHTKTENKLNNNVNLRLATDVPRTCSGEHDSQTINIEMMAPVNTAITCQHCWNQGKAFDLVSQSLWCGWHLMYYDA